MYVTIYHDENGNPCTPEHYYDRLIRIAQVQQSKYPWWSKARRRWRQHERTYRRILAMREVL